MGTRIQFYVLPLLVCSALTASFEAESAVLDVDRAIAASLPKLIDIRHRIHANPELGNREVETAALVAHELRRLGLEVEEDVGLTGVVGVLEGGLPGPVVAVRADMDALPVTEETDLAFRSVKRGLYLGQEVGLAHACGHDIHTSVVLGVAAALAPNRQELAGTVKFIFQPAEEGPPPGEPGGAKRMLDEGAFGVPTPKVIFGLHSWPSLEIGTVGWAAGPTMAAVDHFVVKVRGKQSHGAYPHLGVDPIVMASQVVTALQTIRSRNLSPLEPSVVTVGIIRGGERFNIIPAEVHLEGTVRTFSDDAREEVKRRITKILEGVTTAGGGSYEIVQYQNNAPATINDPELALRVRPALENAVGAESVIETSPTMGGEDFAYFANEVPGFYFRLGVVEKGMESGGLHTPTFRAGDGAVEVGIRAMVGLVLEFLGGPQPTE
ncbi:MAG: amidohydrolase [Acidobacteriota bacterium]|nr:amidohydrolase [Acidobacteriota bacterium]